MTELLTIEEAAEQLRISPRTVRYLCARGKLAHYKPGPRCKILINPMHIDEYLRSIEQHPFEPRPKGRPYKCKHLRL